MSKLSPETLERLHGWVLARCPAVLEDAEALRELVAIVEHEAKERTPACWKKARKLGPCEVDNGSV
jgi:hypothetical protein